MATHRNILSSRLTYFWWLFPLVVFPYLSIWGAYGWIDYVFKISGTSDDDYLMRLSFYTAFTVLFGVGAFALCLPLKIVEIDPDSQLRVSSLRSRTKIAFSQIVEIQGPDHTTLRRIKIHLNSPSTFGDTITFSPPWFHAQRIADLLRNGHS